MHLAACKALPFQIKLDLVLLAVAVLADAGQLSFAQQLLDLFVLCVMQDPHLQALLLRILHIHKERAAPGRISAARTGIRLACINPKTLQTNISGTLGQSGPCTRHSSGSGELKRPKPPVLEAAPFWVKIWSC